MAVYLLTIPYYTNTQDLHRAQFLPFPVMLCHRHIRVVQKFKKLSETRATAPMIANLCMNDSKNRENAEKLVQPVTPHLCRYRGN